MQFMKDFQKKFFADIARHEHIICYGAGSKARQTIPLLLEYGIQPDAVCDSNPEMWGKKFMTNLYIMPYDDAIRHWPDACCILTVANNNAKEIYKNLREAERERDIYHVANPFKVDDGFLSQNDIESHISELIKLQNAFSDKKSKKIFENFLKWKMCGDMFPLFSFMDDEDGNTFFDHELLPKRDDHVFVDVGAYTGDTIMRFLLFCGGRYGRIIGFEPDIGNYTAAKDFVRFSRMPNIEIRNLGLWSKKEEVTFYTSDNENRKLYDSPNFFRTVKHASDNMRFLDVGDSKMLNVSTLDIECKNVVPTIIKINALAADLEVLLGCTETIKQFHPVIIMEYGCRPEHILKVPKILLSLNDEYRLCLRQKEIFGDSKTILYAIPH